MTFILSGWEVGFNKVGMNALLRQYAGLRLAAAKAVVDSILEEETVRVEVPDGLAAEEFLRRSRELGCRMAVAPSVVQAAARIPDRAST